MTDDSSASGQPRSRAAIVSAFETFRIELDDYHDRRERLIKNSRDVTNLSKKVIFLLHRTMMEDEPHSSDGNIDRARRLRAGAKGREKLKEVQRLLALIPQEIQGDQFWRYQRNVSPGLQEYIEALSFVHYLETGKLVSYHEVQQSLSDESNAPYFPLSVEDYLLGLSDLTGELMRYAISAISQHGGRMKAREVCAFVRNCRADFESFTPYCRELHRKQAVTSQSLQKIEDAAYAIAVRSSEYDLPPEMLDNIVASVISRTYGNSPRDGQSRYGQSREEDGDENREDR